MVANTNIDRKELIDNKSIYRTGEIAEDIMIAYFIDKGFDVRDVSKIKAFQNADIDFIVEKDGVKKAIEIKYDGYMNRTGSICLELANVTWNVNSWFYSSKAHYLIVMPKGDEAHPVIFDFTELRKAEHLFRATSQYDQWSRCTFALGILNIGQYRSNGFTAMTLDVPQHIVKGVMN